VLQTRHARSGVMYTWAGRMRVTDRRYKRDFYPIDTRCTCYTCKTFSRAYLHHLFNVGEILAATLASIHNIAWFNQFMAEMRTSIIEGRFEAFRKQVHETYPEGERKEPEGPGRPKSRGGPGSGPHNK